MQQKGLWFQSSWRCPSCWAGLGGDGLARHSRQRSRYCVLKNFVYRSSCENFSAWKYWIIFTVRRMNLPSILCFPYWRASFSGRRTETRQWNDLWICIQRMCHISLTEMAKSVSRSSTPGQNGEFYSFEERQSVLCWFILWQCHKKNVRIIRFFFERSNAWRLLINIQWGNDFFFWQIFH